MRTEELSGSSGGSPRGLAVVSIVLTRASVKNILSPSFEHDDQHIRTNRASGADAHDIRLQWRLIEDPARRDGASLRQVAREAVYDLPSSADDWARNGE